MALADTIRAAGELLLAVVGLLRGDPQDRPAIAPMSPDEAHTARVGQAAGAQASREGKLAAQRARKNSP